MGALADEYIRVRADTTTLSKDLKKEGVKSGKVFGTGFAGGLKGLIGAGAVFGVLAGATSLLKDASAAARESWKVGRQTQAVLKSTGGAANVTQRQIEGLAQAISNKTGIDDEAIQSSANMLLTFTSVRNEVGKGNDIFNQATKTVQDMSVALGQDGKTSAIQLGKALNDPIKGVGALRRVGVAFTDQQKEQITTLVESGNVLGAQKIILAELRKEFGGSAEATATWADKSKVAFENVQETIGGFLNKTLEPVSRWFVEVGAPAIQDFFNRISKDKALKTAVQNLKAALAELTGNADFRQALTDTAAAIPPIVQGLADIVIKYKEISDAVDKFENMSFAGGDKRGGPVGQIIKDFGPGGTIDQAIIYFRIAAPQWVERAWDDMSATFRQRANEAVAGVARFVGQIVAWFVNMKNRVVEWVKRMWNEARASFTQRARELLNGVARFAGQVVGVFTRMKDRVIGVFRTLSSGLRSTVATMMSQLASGFARGVSAIGSAWNRIRAVVATPIAFVVNQVLEGGVLKAFRAISKLVGYGPGTNFHVGWNLQPTRQGGTAAGLASGGVLPGYTPGRDVHRFVSATGGVLNLSGGEGIARPEIVRAMGTKNWNAMNAAARRGEVGDAVGKLPTSFASGGIVAAENLARSMGIKSIGTYPGHHPSQALARDFMTGSNKALGDRFAEALWQNRRAVNLWYEIHWRRIRSMTRESAGWTPYTRANPHTDHVHASFYPAALSGAVGALSSIGAALDPAKYINMVTGALGKLKSIESTPFGQMIGKGARLIGSKVIEKISSLAASFMGGGAGFTAAGGGSNRAIGKRMMLQRWGAGEWPALNSLWTKESGWNHRARNPSSGAYGIPQSLPGSKMASAGADWRTNPATQIKWGLGYIASRYGSPSSAWRHSQATNWYGNGGLINEPVIGMGMRTGQRYGFGERGPETVTPGRGGRPINIMIDLGNGLVERVQGMLDEHDEFHASVARMHR